MQDRLVVTDANGWATLPGRPSERFLMTDLDDGSVLLVPDPAQ